jgi:predicted ABC-type ATPase
VDLPQDRRPIIVALAGANGAGKSTFYHAHLEAAGLRFVNADVLSRELKIGPYEAAKMADSLRRELVKQRESFVFDPVGDKVAFLKDAATAGYTVILCFIGISSPEVSEQRVAMRVSQGGHDVPTDKLETRYPRILANLRNALREVLMSGFSITMTCAIPTGLLQPTRTGILFAGISRFLDGLPRS